MLKTDENPSKIIKMLFSPSVQFFILGDKKYSSIIFFILNKNRLFKFLYKNKRFQKIIKLYFIINLKQVRKKGKEMDANVGEVNNERIPEFDAHGTPRFTCFSFHLRTDENVYDFFCINVHIGQKFLDFSIALFSNLHI